MRVKSKQRTSVVMNHILYPLVTFRVDKRHHNYHLLRARPVYFSCTVVTYLKAVSVFSGLSLSDVTFVRAQGVRGSALLHTWYLIDIEPS